MSSERRLERVLLEGQQRNGQLQEQLSQQLSQSLSTAVCNRLERTIREEMKKTVPQCECGWELEPYSSIGIKRTLLRKCWCCMKQELGCVSTSLSAQQVALGPGVI